MNLIDALLDIGPGQGPSQQTAATALFAELMRLARTDWRARKLGPQKTEEAIGEVMFRLVRGGPRRQTPGNQPTTDARARAYLRQALKNALVSAWKLDSRMVAWPESQREDGEPTPIEFANEEARSNAEEVLDTEQNTKAAMEMVFGMLAAQSVQALRGLAHRTGRAERLDELRGMFEDRFSRADLVNSELKSAEGDRRIVDERIYRAHYRARDGLWVQFQAALQEDAIPPDLVPWVRRVLERLSRV